MCVCVRVLPSKIAGNNRALSAKEAIIIKSKAQLKCHRNKIPYRIAFRRWNCRLGAAFSIFEHTPHRQIKLSHISSHFLHAQNEESRFMYAISSNIENTHAYMYTHYSKHISPSTDTYTLYKQRIMCCADIVETKCALRLGKYKLLCLKTMNGKSEICSTLWAFGVLLFLRRRRHRHLVALGWLVAVVVDIFLWISTHLEVCIILYLIKAPKGDHHRLQRTLTHARTHAHEWRHHAMYNKKNIRTTATRKMFMHAPFARVLVRARWLARFWGYFVMCEMLCVQQEE